MTIHVNSLPACHCGRTPAHPVIWDGSCSLPKSRNDDPCPCHTFRQCLTSTGCDECRVYGDESCGLPVNPDEEN